ncbi:MAG: NAD(P)-dependent oxidoreductase [Desulfotomaculaceae bacterium]
MKKIAILGATSQIAKGLIFNYAVQPDRRLYLFARSTERIAEFIKAIDPKCTVSIHEFNEFSRDKYDVVINCVGIRKTADFADRIVSVFRLTEDYDNLVIQHLEQHPEALYINFSSGAVFGTDFRAPVDEDSRATWEVNKVESSEFYGIAKLNSEIKHRSLKGFNIVDLRIFGYFSRFIDPEAKYLLTEIIACLKSGQELLTDRSNMARDYLHHQDLFALVEKCIGRKALNDVFDAYSRKPAEKREILDYFSKNHGLKYSVRDDIDVASPTGRKDNYYSLSRKAGRVLGYEPEYGSLDCLAQEVKYILK